MEKKDLAKADWKQGMKYKAIAEKYGVSLNTVKSWKVRYWNEKEAKECAHKIKKSVQPKQEKLQPKKQGAPKGNTNAKGNKGGGAPKGNKNNYKHGIYEKLTFETMTPEEQELFSDIDFEELVEMRKSVRRCDIEITRFMSKTKEIAERQSGLVVSGVNKSKTEDSEGKIYSSTNTNTTASYDLVLKYDQAVDRAENRKIKMLDKLIKYSIENERLEIEKKRLELLQEKDKRESKEGVLKDNVNYSDGNMKITIKIGDEDI